MGNFIKTRSLKGLLISGCRRKRPYPPPPRKLEESKVISHCLPREPWIAQSFWSVSSETKTPDCDTLWNLTCSLGSLFPWFAILCLSCSSSELCGLWKSLKPLEVTSLFVEFDVATCRNNFCVSIYGIVIILHKSCLLDFADCCQLFLFRAVSRQTSLCVLPFYRG